MKLKNIADISTGLVLSRKSVDTKIDDFIPYKALSLRSINRDGSFDILEVEEFRSKEQLNEKYLTSSGDIVVRLSEPYTAICIDSDSEGLLVSSNFVIIRLRDIESFTSDYVAYYLNSDFALRQYSSQIVGSRIQIIKSSFLKELEIHCLDMQKQRLIAELNELCQQEIRLLNEMIQEKDSLRKGILKQLVEGGLCNE